MAVDNENGNSTVTTDRSGRRISPGAQLIAEELTRGFNYLKKEMDDNERLIEKKMERREKALMWVIFILVMGTLKNPVFRRVLRVVDELLAGLYRHGSKMRVILYDSLCSVAVRPVFRRFKR